MDMAIVEYLNYEVLDDYGWGIYDEDLFEKAADEDLSEEDYGELDVPGGEYILDAAEAARHDWPFACRNGLCSNCAVILRDGEIEMDGNQVLTEEEVNEKLVRLTCIGRPTSDSLQVIYNAKELDYLRNRLM